MKRALFICTQNRLRSPTAEHVFSTWPELVSLLESKTGQFLK